MPRLSEGQLLAGRYRLDRRLGQGGMAVVYLATDEPTGRPVALKVLNDTFAADPEGPRRFTTEARLAARLSHPNIARVLDAQQGDPAYLVTEYVAGPTLKEYLRQNGPLPLPIAVGIVEQIAAALDAAHAAGIIHRDIKPGNILIEEAPPAAVGQAADPLPDSPTSRDEWPRVKVIDFGIARAADVTEITARDTILGSAAYLAPEQATSGPVTPATDIYALAALTFEMLTGGPPYGNDAPLAVISRKLHEPPPHPLSHRPDLPPAVDATVLAALDRDPNRRPRSAGEFAERLRRAAASRRGAAAVPAAASVPVAAAGAVPRASQTAPLGRSPRMSHRTSTARAPARESRAKGLPAAATALLAILLLLAVAGALALTRGDPNSSSLVTVPDLVGLSQEEAEQQLTNLGLRVAEVRSAPGNPPGVVLDQEPAADNQLPAGSGIRLTTARAPTSPPPTEQPASSATPAPTAPATIPEPPPATPPASPNGAPEKIQPPPAEKSDGQGQEKNRAEEKGGDDRKNQPNEKGRGRSNDDKDDD